MTWGRKFLEMEAEKCQKTKPCVEDSVTIISLWEVT